MDAAATREDDMTLLRDAHSGRFVRTGVWHAAGGMQWRILKVDGRSRTVPGPDGRPAEVVRGLTETRSDHGGRLAAWVDMPIRWRLGPIVQVAIVPS